MTDQSETRRHGWMPDETREHLKAAAEANRKAFDSILPPGFRENRREARRQMLMAARSLIDRAIKRMEAR
ncbi:MAG TPA: hypothetical protein PK954_17610 [Anaerolineales bacterium]|nr:hypothetical protein [Anaerolineales bacterium]HRF48692.1 hypothetical protein [Anaerolineales bacterium]